VKEQIIPSFSVAHKSFIYTIYNVAAVVWTVLLIFNSNQQLLITHFRRGIQSKLAY